MSDPVVPVAPPVTVPPSSGNRGTIVELPPNFPPVSQGDALSGVVAARAAAGQVSIDTEAGQLVLRTALELAENTPVTLQIQTGGQQPQVLIFPSLNSLTAIPPSIPSAIPAVESPVTANISLGGIVTATTGGSVASVGVAAGPAVPNSPSASIVRAGADVANTTTTQLGFATGQNALPPGTILTLQILEILPGGTTGVGTIAQPGSSPAGAARRGDPTGGSRANVDAAGAVSVTARSTELPQTANAGALIRSASVNLEQTRGDGQQVAVVNSEGTVIAANVLVANATGQTVVQTNLCVLTLDTTTTLPPGTGLHLNLIAISGSPAADGGAADPLGQQWTNFAEALNSLQRESPADAQRLMQSVLPQPGPHLALAMLFFMSALQSGNLRGWLGEQATQALARERRPLLERLVDDFMQMQRLATDTSSSEWRAHLIPLFADSQLQQLRVFMRNGNSEESGDSEEAGTRFIIEVDFSKLGAFQFDGFVRQKQFDLIIRTHQDLGSTIHNDINRIFTDTLSALDFSGHVGFHTTPKFDLQPSEIVFGDVRGVVV